MSHVRKQLRDAVVTLLKANSPSKWNYVYNTRIPPSRDNLPYLLVYIDSEASEDATFLAGPIMSREESLITLAHVRIPDNPEDFEDSADSVSIDIENRVTFSDLNSQLTGAVKGIFLTNTNINLIEDDNERSYAEIALTWRVLLMTQGDPETLV